MRITHLGHATLLIETDEVRILIDPGAFSDAWHPLTDLDAVLVTHQHPDHIDAAHIPALIATNPSADWFVEPAVVPMVPSARVRGFVAGDRVGIGHVSIEGVGGKHAVIHPDLPDIGNTGLVLRAEGEPTILHPGDSYAVAPAGVDVAAVPVNAPWSKLAETVEFIRRLDGAAWIPVHDALLSERGRALYVDRAGALGGRPATDLAGGRAIAL